LIDSPSEEEEEEEDEREYDEDEVALFIKTFKKFIKRRPYKGDRRKKLRSKRVCYNCDKNDHFIAQCSYEKK
jgi:hypothetical protein